jgi:hypothetical protein
MDQNNDKDLRIIIQQAAREMLYPATPDITAAVVRRIAEEKIQGSRLRSVRHFSRRWLATALAIFIVILVALSLVPGVRAQFIEFLQVGPLRIFFTNPTPSVIPKETMAAPASLLELAGQTTLSDARNRWDYPIRLPTYPSDLGAPDVVFLQGPVDETLILVWLESNDPNQVYMALQVMAPGDARYSKSAPLTVEETKVNGDEAYWIIGDHLLEMKSGDYELTRLVEGHILAWSDGELTYRLESSFEMEEAVRIAESLR